MPWKGQSDLERILIIGGGATGAALAHDLTLRGFKIIVVEKGSLLSGTSGRHHGLLHSGARYALHDVETARECYAENQILRRLAPQAIEANDGLFVALTDQDMGHLDKFLDHCKAAGIPTRTLTASQAKTLEPGLNKDLKCAVQVPDATMDAWRLPMHFFATAHANGAQIRPFTHVEKLSISAGRVTGVTVKSLRSGNSRHLTADLVVNATGPWAGQITALAGLESPVQPGPGVMVSVTGRLNNMVINRLQPAGEGDILVPQRNLTVIGSTAWLATNPDQVELPRAHIQQLYASGAQLIPALGKSKIHATWCACRPLIQFKETGDPMRISRGFACIDHQEQDDLEGMISVVGGKATTLRAMAQESADLICKKSRRQIACTTDRTPLHPYRQLMQSPKDWI